MSASAPRRPHALCLALLGAQVQTPSQSAAILRTFNHDSDGKLAVKAVRTLTTCTIRFPRRASVPEGITLRTISGRHHEGTVFERLYSATGRDGSDEASARGGDGLAARECFVHSGPTEVGGH